MFQPAYDAGPPPPPRPRTGPVVIFQQAIVSSGGGAGDTGGGGDGGPSTQISINQDSLVHSSSYQIRQMITGIQSRRAVSGEGPSGAAIKAPLASRRSQR